MELIFFIFRWALFFYSFFYLSFSILRCSILLYLSMLLFSYLSILLFVYFSLLRRFQTPFGYHVPFQILDGFWTAFRRIWIELSMHFGSTCSWYFFRSFLVSFFSSLSLLLLPLLSFFLSVVLSLFSSVFCCSFFLCFFLSFSHPDVTSLLNRPGEMRASRFNQFR